MSVVVPSGRRIDRLVDCLRSLFELKYGNYEIIVVGDAPTSSAVAATIRGLTQGFARLRYVSAEPGRRSWRGNRPLLEAEGEIVVFVAPDALVDAGLLLGLLSGFRAAPDVGCVTGLTLPCELETPAQVLLEEYNGVDRAFSRRVFDLERYWVEEQPGWHRVGLTGSDACIAFKAAALKGIGGLATSDSGDQACGSAVLSALLGMLRNRHRFAYEPAAVVRQRYPREYSCARRWIYRAGFRGGACVAEAVARDRTLLLHAGPRMQSALLKIARHRFATARPTNHDYRRDLAIAELKGFVAGFFAHASHRGRS